MSESHPIVLFDGVCGLCNRLVRQILRHDSQDIFRFAPLQSEFGRKVLERHRFNPQQLDSVCLVEGYGEPGERLLVKSDAVLRVAERLNRMAKIGRIVPRSLRDWVYDWIARRRYRIWGRFDQCTVPDEHQKSKFIAL